MAAPQPGPQPQIQFCPACKGDLMPVDSTRRKAPNANKYVCAKCKSTFEINDMT